MKMLISLVTLSVLQAALFGLTEARRLGANRPDERITPEHEDASFGEHERNLQQGERTFSSNPNALIDNDNYIRVMVGFKNDNGRKTANRMGKKWMREMKNSRVATMLIPRVSLESLQSNPNIEFVEEDGMMTADSELVPFGISMTKGDSSIIPASRGSSSACSDPDSFKVAIIDSGVEVGHPDIPCRPVADPDTNCKGISIGIDDLWYAPTGKAGHGTHVFGTIGAVGGNDKGVAGMVPDSDGICYLIARVFDDEGKGGFASSTFEAVDWAVSEGANIINMSLGSATYYQAGQAAITSAHALGALTVSSAGNSGTKSLQYPASFDDAISVAAVNTDGTRASFSQYNAKVDIAAPGVRVLSTYLDGGYTAMSGTSMAVPHVTGAIAKVWSVCRQCSNVQVESCLLNAASNASRRTNELGFGIVNADDTYDCLVNTGGCCAEAKEAEQEPVQAVPEPVQAVPEPVPRPAPEPVPEPAQEPAQEAAQALVQALVQAPVQAVPRVPYCPRRDTGEKCRRDAHCCSGKCAGSWPDMTCQAVFGL